jgi:fatty acid desaturase
MYADKVRGVEWRDLTALRPWEVLSEPLLPLPWLAASLLAADRGWRPAAVACSFMLFLTGLRVVHNAYHYALGLPRWATEWVMFAMSLVMQCSMHAVKVNHLRHHRYCMSGEDVEAMSVRLSGWGAILIGPWFPVRLHIKAMQVGTPAERRWILAELAANAAWIALVFGVLQVPLLRYHVIAMCIGECLTAFFAVWTVHHGCEDGAPIARSLRSTWMSRLAYGMFYHLEHHLFPRVPTCHLETLARRLDQAAPGYARRMVL